MNRGRVAHVTTRIDCHKPELDTSALAMRCRWCGRPCKWTYSGKLHHRRGYRRVWDDPREVGGNHPMTQQERNRRISEGLRLSWAKRKELLRIMESINRYEHADPEEIDSEEYQAVLQRYEELRRQGYGPQPHHLGNKDQPK